MKNVTVDFSKKTGRAIKPMHAVNNGPAGSRVRQTRSNFDAFRAAGIPYARTHDSSFYTGYGGEHTVDVHRIFKNFDADENLPESYDFEMTDMYMADILSVGTKPFYRLGASIEHQKKYGTRVPKDFAKWARICEHIIRHYNEGWADGFRYGIEYWEIWNEPECKNADGTTPCWQGTIEQFAEFFITAHRHLKGCFPHLKIGGPALCSPWNEQLVSYLLGEFKKAELSLDFFSYHCYCWVGPHSLRETIEQAQKMLEKYGFADTPAILNEWNYCKGWLGEDYEFSMRAIKGLFGSSLTMGGMLLAQKSPLAMLMYYEARPCAWSGMFATEGLYPLKGYYPFVFFNELYRLENEVETTEDDGEHLMTGAATDGAESALALTYFLSADEEATPATVRIALKGLPEGGSTVTTRVIDADHDGTPLREDVFTTREGALYLTIAPHTSLLLTVTAREQ